MAENKKSFLDKVIDSFRRFGRWFKKQNGAVQAIVIFAGLLIIGIPIKASESGSSTTQSETSTATQVSNDENNYSEILERYSVKTTGEGSKGVQFYAKLDLNGDYKTQVKEIIPAVVNKYPGKVTYGFSTDNIYKTKPVEQELLDMNDGIDIWSDKDSISVASYNTRDYQGNNSKEIFWLYPEIDGGSEKFEF